MALDKKQVMHKGKKYVINEMSYSDLKLQQDFIKKNKIEDPELSFFVILTFCVKTTAGKAVFPRNKYKEIESNYSGILLGKLISAVNEINDFSTTEKVEGN